MFCQRVHFAMLAGVLTAVAAIPARAADGTAAPAPCCTQTVTCTEWVPQQIQCTRTVYRSECRPETYTAYRTECVAETRTKTVYKAVQETKTQLVTQCVNVQVVEERCHLEKHIVCKPVTCTVRTCVQKGHWECREVPCGPSFKERLHKLCSKHNDCCCEQPCCVRTRTERVWVKCPVYCEKQVTHIERCCEYRPVTCKVTVCKRVSQQVPVQVCCWKCVPEQCTYTVMCPRQVAYQATRQVRVCVPVQEAYTVCKLVPRTVQREVAVNTCCNTCNTCNTCTTSCKQSFFHRCSGLSFRQHGCGCN